MLAAFLSLPRFLYAIVDIFAACVGEQHGSVVGFARLWRIQLFDLCFAVLQQFGGNFRREFYLAFFKEAVIFPHHKATFTIRAIIVLPALKNGFTATGTFADSLYPQTERIYCISYRRYDKRRRGTSVDTELSVAPFWSCRRLLRV